MGFVPMVSVRRGMVPLWLALFEIGSVGVDCIGLGSVVIESIGSFVGPAVGGLA